jgi:hypothetical protein
MKRQRQVLNPIPEKEMSEWAHIALRAHRRATRKKRAELRQRGLPMIIWKDGRVREVPRVNCSRLAVSRRWSGRRGVLV